MPFEYYGDNVRWFIATVIDASPPFGFEGRVKIRIHGTLRRNIRIATIRLRKLRPMCSSTTEGGISGIGKSPKLQPNSLVFGFFMDGNHSQLQLF